jgi:hypothetical protein
MDYALKNYCDHFRGKGLPSELDGNVPGRLLPDEARINEMRKTSFRFQVNAYGA